MKCMYYILGLLMLITIDSNAQVTVTNKGVEITNTSDIYIKGSYINTSSAAIANGGSIYITNDLINNSNKKLFVTASGNAVFAGSAKQTIQGDSINFYSLIVDKPLRDIELKSKIYVADTLNMKSGNMGIRVGLLPEYFFPAVPFIQIFLDSGFI